MNAFLVSAGLVAIAEIGDKTQLLAFVLAARFRKPWSIVFGILAATLLNHGLAGALGSWLPSLFDSRTLRWIIGASFVLMALWTLIPDKLNDADDRATRFGVFGTTLVAFFLVEIGDKTQIATVVLAAQYQALAEVVLGTTLGMMIANVPIVLLGERLARRIPLQWVRAAAAVIFLTLGSAILLGFGGEFTAPMRR